MVKKFKSLSNLLASTEVQSYTKRRHGCRWLNAHNQSILEESNERKMGRECQTSLKCVPEAAAMSSGWALPTYNWLSLPGTKMNAKKDHDNV
ncbi:uncharacterized protein EAF02_007283 [Botrytis sinoallii]|uniref:uncharacterized protein n=1 Tax=Botrytis sinoallii TaxID=1463999 RepID=UPI001902AA61|nr:uncharacterized protein EAF02_007283 [Botrytis sinoallii]KAF7880437.1 hypothetical protein EAF02_007283 [Botrytis sinoallii]